MLDLSSGLGCLLVGHSHPKVVEAVQRQAARFSHTDFSVVAVRDLRGARGAARRTGRPAAGKVALFNSGAEAVENAVKFAKAATGRPAVICFEGAFHGRTLLTMSLTSRHTPYKRGFGPFAPEVYRVPFSYPYRSDDPDGRAGARARSSGRSPRSVDPRVRRGGHLRARAGRGRLHRAGTARSSRAWRRCAARTASSRSPTRSSRGSVAPGRFLASEHFGLDPDIVILAKALAVGVSALGGGRADRDHGRARAVGDRRHVRGQPGRVCGRERGARRDRGGGPDRARRGRRQGDPHPLGAARASTSPRSATSAASAPWSASRWCPTARRRSRTATTSGG